MIQQPSGEESYQRGKNCDDKEGIEEKARWFRLAADQGHAIAQYELGVMCATSRGVSQSDTEAVRWWHLSADQGNARAQVNLGVAYNNGLGVQQNNVTAYMWFNLSASRGDRDARERAVKARDRVAAILTPDQLAEGQRLAAEWDAAHPTEPQPFLAPPVCR